MNLLQELKELLLPRTCAVCKERLLPEEKELCASCSIALPRIPDGGMACARKIWPYVAIEGSLTMFYYNRYSKYRNIIHHVKDSNGESFCQYMGRWAITEFIQKGNMPEVDLLVPVPLIKKRLRSRGYNQSRAIAEGMSQILGIPVLDCLVRNENSKIQKKLNYYERKENTINQFKATIPPEYKKRTFMIVDDVTTTGSTLAACAEAIFSEAPESKVYISALAQSI